MGKRETFAVKRGAGKKESPDALTGARALWAVLNDLHLKLKGKRERERERERARFVPSVYRTWLFSGKTLFDEK